VAILLIYLERRKYLEQIAEVLIILGILGFPGKEM